MNYTIKKAHLEEIVSADEAEGLVFQGCGGDLQEWANGVNDMLTEDGILKDGQLLDHIYQFNEGEIINLVFMFKPETRVNIGKLAVWRIRRRDQFGCMWFSDYCANKLGEMWKAEGRKKWEERKRFEAEEAEEERKANEGAEEN